MFLTMVALLRFYSLFHYFAKYSKWTTDQDYQKICSECHCFGGVAFAIKCELKVRPYKMIIIAIGISIFLFGYAVRAAEL
jgi:hypothetical protein